MLAPRIMRGTYAQQQFVLPSVTPLAMSPQVAGDLVAAASAANGKKMSGAVVEMRRTMSGAYMGDGSTATAPLSTSSIFTEDSLGFGLPNYAYGAILVGAFMMFSGGRKRR